MGARIGKRTVYITDAKNVVHRLNPGDDVPPEFAEFFVGEDGQPHRALVEGTGAARAEKAAESEGAGDGTPGTAAGDGYEDLGYPELKALAKKRELPQDGKTADLIARLREDDAEKAAESEGAGDGTPGDEENQE